MKAIKKITSVFLLVAFLLSSLGFTINKMVCLKSGKTKISLTHVKNCCPEKRSSVPTIKSNCCDLTNSSFSLDDFNSVQKNNVSAAVSGALPIWQNRFISDLHLDNTSSIAAIDLPPPLHGRKLLSFISILII